MSTANQAREATYDALVTAWNASGAASAGTGLCFDNEKFDPPGNAPWARAVVREMKSVLQSFGGVGNRRYRRDANLIVQVFLPPNMGTQKADAIAAVIRSKFEGAAISDLYFEAVTVKEIGNVGAWFQYNVSAAFWYEEIK